MLVGYARVSTDLQTTDGQIDALHAAGCERVFEESMSGTRTEPAACCRPGVRPRGGCAGRHPARSTGAIHAPASDDRGHLAGTWHRTAVAPRGHRYRERDRTADPPHLRCSWTIRGGALRERTRTALAASRARGRIGGRPPALDAIKVTAAKAMLASGTMTASEVARQVGCSASTLYRHVPGGRTAVAESGMSAAA